MKAELIAIKHYHLTHDWKKANTMINSSCTRQRTKTINNE